MYEIGQREIEAVKRVIRSRYLFRFGSRNREVDSFEKAMRDWLGVEHFLAVSNGTAAIICGLVGMGVGPGDEVIIPAYTFVAVPSAVLNIGAIPVIAEINETLCIDPDDIERKITPRTKAIIPADILGFPCDMDAIMAIARKHRLFVLEDACQAVGGSYGGRLLASIGHAGTLSFNHYKNIVCGEGGGLATNDRKIYERALIYHEPGSSLRPYARSLKSPVFAGDNYRMDEIHAAIMKEQLKRLPKILQGLRQRKKAMSKILQDGGAFECIPSNDSRGDCGTRVGVLFPSIEQRKRFCMKMNMNDPAVNMLNPTELGGYVYTEWVPVMERRGSLNPAMDPYRLPANRKCRMKTGKDSCPTTLDLLGRTAFVLTDLKHDPAYFEKLARKMIKVAETI